MSALTDDIDDYDPDDAVCKFCGKENLHWADFYKKDGSLSRALFNEKGRRHDCTAKPDASAFDVVLE